MELFNCIPISRGDRDLTDRPSPHIIRFLALSEFAQNEFLKREYSLLVLIHYASQTKVVPEGWAVAVSRLTLAVIFSITPFLYQSSSVCYTHSQMQKRSMVYLFWTMGYSDQAVRNKTFNSN